MSEPSRIHGRTRDEWERMCLAKRRYPDEPVARATGGQMFDRGAAKTKRLFVYQCPNCRGFHLTRSGWNKSHPITAETVYA